MSVDSWTLQVKSLEQVTQSVTISSSASVLQLKDAIQPVFDVESNRQRLIFQGKVLKDGKQLTEYANLQDGKVIHMVSRPPGAPRNVMNDDPPSNTHRGTSPQMFPMFGPSEGYTFISVDANISDLSGNPQQSLATVLSGLFDGGLNRNNFMNSRTFFGGHGRSPLGLSQNTRTATGNIGTRPRNLPTQHPTRTRRQANNFPSLLDSSRPYTTPVSALEIRLTRALAAIENIQTTLEAPAATTGTSQLTWTSMSNATPEQSQAIRSQLRANRSNGLAQTGLAVDRLADLMEALTPRLRQLAQDLQSHTRPRDEVAPELRRMITVIRSLSMVNHAIGNIMASSDDSSRRPGGLRSSPLGRMGRGTTTTSTNATSQTTSPANTRRRQQLSARNQSSDTTTTASSNKRKSKLPVVHTSSSTSSSSSSSSSSTSASATASTSSSTSSTIPKRQKTNSDNTDNVDSQTPSSSTRKGKGKSQAKPNGD